MRDTYVNPLCERYSGKEMKYIFSPDKKFSTWRKLWIALAEAEKELGLNIGDDQIEQMKENIYNIDYDKAREYESKVRHDVMAHVLTFGDLCPLARPIIHLGATSCYVGDNTDIIVMKEALLHVRKLLINTIAALSEFAMKHKNVATLAYTHFQAAQPTTMGKRSTLWIHDLLLDLENLDNCIASLKLLGCKGTTGTSASFLKLFNGDTEKVYQLEKLIAAKMGFEGCYPVSGQTYSRKVDFNVLSVLSQIAQSASKFATDIRLLSHLKEFDEPFESGQIGSSAMAYKRNPMRCERICALSRYIICDAQNPAVTAATQWLERTLDDSANRRISLPEAFLATDAILTLYINVISNGRVYPGIMKRHLDEEMPFMASENIMMYCVNKGKDRQTLHEAVRRHSVDCAHAVKERGEDNDLLERIVNDPEFGITKEEIEEILASDSFTGAAEQQTEMFIEAYVKPVLEENKELLGVNAEIRV